MKIFNLKTTQQNGYVRLSVSIESNRLGPKELWFATPEEYEHCLCKNRMDGFMVGMLFPAMQYGEDMHLAGCVSQKLLFCLNNYVVPLLLAFSPSCKRIKITADKISSERFDCKGVGSGFSGGVDSFCTIYDRYELEESPEFQINRLLFLNVGSHGWGEQEEDLLRAKDKFQQRYAYLKKFPEEIGLDFIPLDSNLHVFHPWGHQKTCTLTMVAGILLLQHQFCKYYCASIGWSYLEVLKYHQSDMDKDIAIFDSFLLPLLSTESLEFISDGILYTRVEKTLRIADYTPAQQYLNVCVGSTNLHENCSVCSKCCRTLMTLKSAGISDRFSNLFDLEKYKKMAERRYIYSQIVLQRKDPFAYGNIELAKQHNVKLPSLLFSYFVYSNYWLTGRFVKFLKSFLSPAAIRTIKGFLGK